MASPLSFVPVFYEYTPHHFVAPLEYESCDELNFRPLASTVCFARLVLEGKGREKEAQPYFQIPRNDDIPN